MAKQHIPDKLKPWIDARKRFHLSHAHIQMARELGMNPKKFGGLANYRQERWKVPLPQFIAEIYFKRFGKNAPDHVRSIEDMVAAKQKKKSAKKQAKLAAALGTSETPSGYPASLSIILEPVDCSHDPVAVL
jgi:hypothetical protein